MKQRLDVAFAFWVMAPGRIHSQSEMEMEPHMSHRLNSPKAGYRGLYGIIINRGY